MVACIITGCADPQFLDKTRNDQSILNGKPVQKDDSIAQRTVMIAQEIDFGADKPVFFGLCSGVLIEPQIVLTAAHCIAKNSTKMRVVLNPTPRNAELRGSRDVFSVHTYRVHPNYKHVETTDEIDLASRTDLALIFLDRPTDHDFMLDYTNGKDFESNEYSVVMAGFGKTSDLKDTSNISHTKLNGQLFRANAVITDSQTKDPYFSLDQWKSGGVCKGDSGSPVFILNPLTSKLSLFAIAIDVFKNNPEQDHLRDPGNIYSTCASYGLFLNLKPHEQWIKNMSSEMATAAKLIRN